ncbi:hypothetical protein RJ641_023238 [Dillenia turbinata]|uniref:Uncharacterized protein n=1 Tax=Dillenia turbinata TaxID=194707 RepID=A0AAN8YSK5_9MAGN
MNFEMETRSHNQRKDKFLKAKISNIKYRISDMSHESKLVEIVQNIDLHKTDYAITRDNFMMYIQVQGTLPLEIKILELMLRTFHTGRGFIWSTIKCLQAPTNRKKIKFYENLVLLCIYIIQIQLYSANLTAPKVCKLLGEHGILVLHERSNSNRCVFYLKHLSEDCFIVSLIYRISLFDYWVDKRHELVVLVLNFATSVCHVPLQRL